jgi:hypothetical protein
MEPGLHTGYCDYARDWTNLGLIPGGGKIFFSSPKPTGGSRAHPVSYSMESCVLCWVKGVGRAVDLLPPSSAELKNEWSYTSTSTVCLHGVYIISVLRYAVQFGKSVPTFQRNLMPLSCR